MAKSVFALVVGILLMLCSGAAYVYLTRTAAEDTPATTAGTTTPDSGAVACESVRALHESGGAIGDIDAATIAGLTSSGNENLQAAGEAFELVAALPEDQRGAASAEVVAALTHLAAGCAAVGVPLPSELVNPEQNPS